MRRFEAIVPFDFDNRYPVLGSSAVISEHKRGRQAVER